MQIWVISELNDIEEAIGCCNFNKTIGQDGFSGQTIKTYPEYKSRFAALVRDWLNDGYWPDYVNQGKLVLFSKNNKYSYKLEDTRPIVVKSHILKFIEKSIRFKVGKLGS